MERGASQAFRRAVLSGPSDEQLARVDAEIRSGRLPAQVFADIALLPDRNPWVKVALLCHAYMSPVKELRMVGGVAYGEAVKKASVQKLAENTEFLNEAERMLHHHLKGCQLRRL